MTKLKVDQTCASCVMYQSQADSSNPKTEYSWIITKVEKKLPNGKYSVVDEYVDEEGHDETYIVESNRIAPFPAPNDDYQVGDRVLALWKDEETNQWTTMFFEATVKAIKPEKIVTILYAGSKETVDIEASKLTRFPPDFDIPSDGLGPEE